MQIRPACEDESLSLAQLHHACLGQDWPATTFSAWLRQPDYHLWVAEKQSGICGYCILRVIPPEAEIIALGVDASSRRKGIAKSLLQHALEALGPQRCFLEVSAYNAPARALYASLGFEETGLRARYYKDGTDAVIMVRFVSAP